MTRQNDYSFNTMNMDTHNMQEFPTSHSKQPYGAGTGEYGQTLYAQTTMGSGGSNRYLTKEQKFEPVGWRTTSDGRPRIAMTTATDWRTSGSAMRWSGFLSALGCLCVMFSYGSPWWRQFKTTQAGHNVKRFDGLWLFCIELDGIEIVYPEKWNCFSFTQRDIYNAFEDSSMTWCRVIATVGMLSAFLGTVLTLTFVYMGGFQRRRHVIVALVFHIIAILLYGFLVPAIFVSKSITDDSRGSISHLVFLYSFWIGVAGDLLIAFAIFASLVEICRSDEL